MIRSSTRPSRLPAAALMLLAALAAAPVTAAPMAYVPNQRSGTISVIDTGSDEVVRTLSAQGQLGKRLQQVALDPAGKTLFVIDAAHDALVALDIATDSVRTRVPIEDDAEGVTVSPDGASLAVCVEGSQHILLVDAATLKIRSDVATQGRNPEHCVFSPDGKWLLTSNEASSDLDVIDVAAGRSVAVIKTSGHPRGMAFLPKTTRLYVAQETANVVDVIDLAARSKIASIATGLRTAGLTVSADGAFVYASNGGAGSVSVIDVAKGEAVAEIKVGERPWNPALTPDGRKLYVANGRSNSVSVIDTATRKKIKDIPVGELPWGVVIGK